MKLELDYSGGIFLWFRAGILRNRIKEENLYILQYALFLFVTLQEKGKLWVV